MCRGQKITYHAQSLTTNMACLILRGHVLYQVLEIMAGVQTAGSSAVRWGIHLGDDREISLPFYITIFKQLQDVIFNVVINNELLTNTPSVINELITDGVFLFHMTISSL